MSLSTCHHVHFLLVHVLVLGFQDVRQETHQSREGSLTERAQSGVHELLKYYEQVVSRTSTPAGRRYHLNQVVKASVLRAMAIDGVNETLLNASFTSLYHQAVQDAQMALLATWKDFVSDIPESAKNNASMCLYDMQQLAVALHDHERLTRQELHAAMLFEVSAEYHRARQTVREAKFRSRMARREVSALRAFEGQGNTTQTEDLDDKIDELEDKCEDVAWQAYRDLEKQFYDVQTSDEERIAAIERRRQVKIREVQKLVQEATLHVEHLTRSTGIIGFVISLLAEVGLVGCVFSLVCDKEPDTATRRKQLDCSHSPRINTKRQPLLNKDAEKVARSAKS